MKIGDRLHGFEVVRISPKGSVTWLCQTCDHKVRLWDHVPAGDILRSHATKHPPGSVWPFPRFDINGVPTSPVWRAAILAETCS